MAKSILTSLDLQSLPALDTPRNGSINFAAKSDGLYQKIGAVESKLSTTEELLDRVKTAVPLNAKFTDTTYGVATTSANGLMSSADKSKLNGIATGANNYVHPSSHPISFITGLQGALNLKANLASPTFTGNVLIKGAAADSPLRVRGIDGHIDSTGALDNLYLNYVSTKDISMVMGGGNVGIGTTSPIEKLEVTGNIASTGGANGRYSVLSPSGLRSYGAASGWVQGHNFFMSDETSLGFSSGAYASNISTFNYFFYGGAYTDPSVVILPNKNVGIGTITPTYKLDVSGTGRFTGDLDVGTNTSAKINMGRSTYNYITTPTGGGLSIITNGDSASAVNSNLIVSPNGNVGVGKGFTNNTTSITAQLHVRGTILSTGEVTAPTFKGNLTGLASLNLPLAGGTMTGILKAQNNTSYTTKQVRNIIMSTANASAASMANGDIWIKYE